MESQIESITIFSLIRFFPLKYDMKWQGQIRDSLSSRQSLKTVEYIYSAQPQIQLDSAIQLQLDQLAPALKSNKKEVDNRALAHVKHSEIGYYFCIRKSTGFVDENFNFWIECRQNVESLLLKWFSNIYFQVSFQNCFCRYSKVKQNLCCIPLFIDRFQFETELNR